MSTRRMENMQRIVLAIFPPFVEIIKNKSLLEVQPRCPTFFYLLP